MTNWKGQTADECESHLPETITGDLYHGVIVGA